MSYLLGINSDVSEFVIGFIFAEFRNVMLNNYLISRAMLWKIVVCFQFIIVCLITFN